MTAQAKGVTGRMKKITMKDVRKQDYYYAEAIKTLQTNVNFAGKDVKAILITSCYPNEGKSDIAFSLAKEIASSGKRVLLLDADLRKSSYVGRYQVQEKVSGLSQFLSGQIGVGDLMYVTNFENLDMIFAGPSVPNPTALLGEGLFGTLLKKLREYYDYIFIDTPPVGSLIDAAIVAEKCDGAIFVVESEAVSYKVAKKAVDQIEKSGCRILGGVLNKVDMKKDKYYSHYKDRYHTYYEKIENRQEDRD